MHHILRVNPIFSTVLSQDSKLLVIVQLHPCSIQHLMSNIYLHNTIQHAFLMQVQASHLCIVILSRSCCTHHHQQQQRRQWIIVAVPTETKLGSTTFRFGSEHERKMSSIAGGRLCITSAFLRSTAPPLIPVWIRKCTGEYL